MVSAKLMIALACLNACAVHGSGEAAAHAIEGISSTQDEPVAALMAEKVEFLGYVNDSNVSTRDTDCRQWPMHNEQVTVGEVWWENNAWYGQTLKTWNHRHALEWGECIETRFGGDKDKGQWFYAQNLPAGQNEWTLHAYMSWNLQLTKGIVGWNGDKARWQPCSNIAASCGGGSRFAMNTQQCFRIRLASSGRVVQACKTYTNQDNRICGEYSRKHHGINRCGTGRDSYYWFGTEEGCRYAHNN